MGVCMKQVILTSVFMVATSFGTSATELTKEKGTELCPVATYASGGICLMEEGGSTYVYTKDIEPIIVPEPVVPPREPKLTDEQKFKVLAVAYMTQNNGDIGVEPTVPLVPIGEILPPTKQEVIEKVSEELQNRADELVIETNPLKLSSADQQAWRTLAVIFGTEWTQDLYDAMEKGGDDKATIVKGLMTELQTNLEGKPVKQILAFTALNNISVCNGLCKDTGGHESKDAPYDSVLDQLINGGWLGSDVKEDFNTWNAMSGSEKVQAIKDHREPSNKHFSGSKAKAKGWTKESAKKRMNERQARREERQ